MDFSLPFQLPANSFIRAAEPGVDRDITVLIDGAHTTMKESALARRAGMHEDDNEIAVWVEYRLEGVVVHRSAHMHLKKAAVFASGEAASVG